MRPSSPLSRWPIPGNALFIFLIVVGGLSLLQGFLETPPLHQASATNAQHYRNLDLVVPESLSKVAHSGAQWVSIAGKFRDDYTEKGRASYRYLEQLQQYRQLQQTYKHSLQAWKRAKVVVKESQKSFTTMVQGSGEQTQSTWQTKVAGAVRLSQLRSVASDYERWVRQLLSGPLELQNSAYKEGIRERLANFDTLFQDVGFTTARDNLRLEVVAIGQLLEKLLQEPTPLKVHAEEKKLHTQTQRLASEKKRLKEILATSRQSIEANNWYFGNREWTTQQLRKVDPEQFSLWFDEAKGVWQRFEKTKGSMFHAPDQPLTLVLEKEFRSETNGGGLSGSFFTIASVLGVILLLYFLFARGGNMGSGAFTFGKSPAKLLQKGAHKVTFKDVAGIDEAREELEEIVEFLKAPKKFKSLGAQIPKGVLCVGPPGTGKTLIAKAVAGEADRPFFSISGSDFVEMFVGVGASRIRDLFEQARKAAPCIVFIDEIDAVGRQRGSNIGGGGHDEREQTLNQLLVEMDGFASHEGIILVAATNRPDILDKALLRPGRFDRRVTIDLPDIKGREEILHLHAQKIKCDKAINLVDIARGTAGCSGADLKNILNEAALLAVKRGQKSVKQPDLLDACDKVLFGKERRSLELDADEKNKTAYHEAGHAIVAMRLPYCDPVEKVTIIPRGMALGATYMLPQKNRVGYWQKEIHQILAMMLGGRCAEDLFLKDRSSGASNDLERATSLARRMVCDWGMDTTLGLTSLKEEQSYLGSARPLCSEKTLESIDTTIKNVLDTAYKQAEKILKKDKKAVDMMAQALLEFETIDKVDAQNILDGCFSFEEKRAAHRKKNDAH